MMPVLQRAFLAVVASVCALCAAAAGDDVLYWMVDSGATVTDAGGARSSVGDFFDALGVATESSYYAARVRVTGGDVTGDVFLDLYIDDGEGGFFLDEGSGMFGVAFGDSGSGYWGAGVPAGNISPSGSYADGTPEYSFIVELGSVLWDAATETASWTTVAASDPALYSDLDGGNFIDAYSSMSAPSHGVWSPRQFTAVPEPSCGVLALLGLALVALRRRVRGPEAGAE